MNAIPARLGADVNDWIAHTCGFSVEDLILLEETQGEGIDQWVLRVAFLEDNPPLRSGPQSSFRTRQFQRRRPP